VRRLTLVMVCLVMVAGGMRAAAAPAPGLTSPSGAGSDTARVPLGKPGEGTTAFVAWPPGTDSAPAIVVVHEWWGLNGQIRSVARRLAQEGYVTIVPDLYHGRVAGDPEYAHEISRGLVEGRALADLEAGLAWLRLQPRVDRRRIGVIGFCMGGRLSQLLALRNPTLAASVMFYGSPETDPAKLASLRVPLQAHFGGEDRGIGADQVEGLRSGLGRARKTADIYVYPGAGHAFMNDTQPSYHSDAARQAWARTLQFFQKYLKG
jgi:carboxymethylenebutenolidase